MEVRNISSSFQEQMKSLFSYFRHLKDVKLQFFTAIVCGIICGISSGFGVPFILKIASKHVFSVPHLSPIYLVLFCLFPVVMMGIRGISGFYSSYYIGFCGQRLLEKIRIQVFAK
ncbi:MAG: hypothetical protein LBG98_00130, partial [Puniceicoccales bacterium]|nr:hypothetical protein [Puniceicoccales bacterium]